MKALPTLVIASAIVASGIIGYQLGSKRNPSDNHGDTEAVAPAAPSERSRTLAHLADSPSSDASAADASAGRLSFRQRMEAALAHESPRRLAYEVERLFENLTLESAPQILANLRSWPDSAQRRNMLRPFFVRWAQLDGPTALQAAKTFSGRERGDTISAAYAGWAKTDPYSAWDDAQIYFADASPFVVQQARGVIDELAKRDLTAALTAVESFDGGNYFNSMFHIAMNAAFESNQVGGLLDHAMSLENSEQRERWITSIFSRWGEADTEAPLDALASIADPTLAKEAMTGFLQGWGRADEEGALSYGLSNANNPLVADTLGPLLRNALMHGGKTDNRALVAQLSEAKLIDQFAQEIVGGASFANPELAFEIASLVSDEERKSQFRQQAIAGWARNDFPAARSQFEAIPEAAERAKLLPNLIWQQSQRPEGGAILSELMQTLPPGPERTQAVEGLLATTGNPRIQTHPNYLQELKTLALSEANLSEPARRQLDRLVSGN